MLGYIRDGAKDDKRKIYLLVDRASFHGKDYNRIAPEVQKACKEYNIELILNVAYSFQFMPVERVWSRYK